MQRLFKKPSMPEPETTPTAEKCRRNEHGCEAIEKRIATRVRICRTDTFKKARGMRAQKSCTKNFLPAATLHSPSRPTQKCKASRALWHRSREMRPRNQQACWRPSRCTMPVHVADRLAQKNKRSRCARHLKSSSNHGPTPNSLAWTIKIDRQPSASVPHSVKVTERPQEGARSLR